MCAMQPEHSLSYFYEKLLPMKYLLEGEETERLRLRLLADSDFETWTALFENTEAARFVGMDTRWNPVQCCQTWFERSKSRYENDLGGMNVLVHKQTGELIGQAGLLIQEVAGEKIMEVGYSILPKYWAMGYATEAARYLRDRAFACNYAADALYSIIHIENTGSMKVAERNGMQIHRSIEFKGMPVHIFRITRKEWGQL